MKQIMTAMTQKAIGKKILTASIAAICTSMITTSVTQASDIEIYQTAKSGDITLMFLLDISGSMNGNDSGQSGTRITRVRNAMIDLLQGNTTKGIAKISDDKIIGLSTLGYICNRSNPSQCWNNTGQVLIPARKLDASVGSITQRQVLINAVNNLVAYTGTPTARSYSEAIAYMMGKKTSGTGSGFSYSVSESKISGGARYQAPESLTQLEDIKKCSGQGIYVLTDGEPNGNDNTQSLMREALANNNFSCVNEWDCAHKSALAILDPDKNPQGLKFKTAVVGFGNSFNNIASYNKSKTQEQNIAALGNINWTYGYDHVKKAAYWGIIGEGGWYSGNSSQDVVDSVNEFISSLGSDIPAVTTGSPTIPVDSLNPVVRQNDAYYPQFQPTPDKNYQLWLGNMKKFLVTSSGKLVDKNKKAIVDSQGRIIQPTYDSQGNISTAIYDYWATPNVNTNSSDADKRYAATGGVWSQLKLRVDNSNNIQRKLLTNRVFVSGSGASSIFGSSANLRQVKQDYITDGTYKNDPNRGYLMALLGYNVDAANPSTITATSLTAAPELRQLGAVMHSSPILITNKGKVVYNTSTEALDSKNREDYVLFGTTQGLLHVVDAETGQEKFAFVPNEMVENQKAAFLKPEESNGGMSKLYYGIDGQWTTYTEYVVDNDGNLTVGKGKGSLEGKQFAYGGLRMGGRSYYALDLSNINSPTLKFHIDPATKTVYRSSGKKTYNELEFMAQSWSKPTIAWVNWGGKNKQVMFVGGGYDAGGDDGDARVNNTKLAYAGYEGADYEQKNKKGAGVYMFSADGDDAGELLWWASDNATASSSATATSGVIATKDANLKYSVASEIRTIDRDGDGLADQLYFGDLAGQVFRIDIDNNADKLGKFVKRSTRLLNLYESGGKSPRFYDMPAFSTYNYNGNTFAVITIGSGNRSLPLKDYTVGTGYNYDSVYNIYDKDVAHPDLYKDDYSIIVKDIQKTALAELSDADRKSSTTLKAPYASKGWYYQFKSDKVQSEKVFGTPLVMNYRLYASTFDASKPGLSGDCGAGVKGESFLTGFCMPYGQCDATKVETDFFGKQTLGAGIQTVTVRGGGESDGTGGSGSGGSNIKDLTKNRGGAINACISTGALAVYNPVGGGKNQPTKICLIPERWYDKLTAK